MKIIRPAFLLAASAALTAPGLHAEPQRGLDLTVTGLHSAKGRIIACLWHEKTRFPSCEKSKTALKRTFPVTGTTMRVSLPLPAAGRYAVTVVHDEDGNGKMKRNFIGMPTEGVGISNNPGGMPGFEKSLVDVAPGSAMTIRMKYLFG